MKKLLNTSLLGLLIILSSACGREHQSPIPFVYVNFNVYLNNPSNSHLLVPGNYSIMKNEGNHGIILYRRTLGEEDDFVAFDLTCSNEPMGNCIVEVDSTLFYLECPCCDSKFSIFDGFPTSGPAQWQLKQYSTSRMGSTLRVYN